MDNHAIAQVFDRVARLMEANGDSPFKVRAYRRVADEFARLPVPLGQLAIEGRLKTVPGVGIEIEKKVRELLDTGSLNFYQRLVATVPEGLLELMDLPGVSPKLAGRFWRELGVTNRDQLAVSLRDGRAGLLPRIPRETVSKLSQALIRPANAVTPSPPGAER
mgnify:FL=1